VIYHTIGTVQKSNRKIVERGKIYTGTNNNDEVKLFLESN